MQKATWKFKRSLNLYFFYIRHYPKVATLFKEALYYIRLFLRLFKPAAPDAAIEKVYSDRNEYLYVANPKVATRSVISYLEIFDGCNLCVNHQTFSKFIENSNHVSKYYRFSFVRNPWARTYSCWLDKITNQHKFCDITIISRYRGLYPDMPFEKFVEWLCSHEGQDRYADRHWMSQYKLLGDLEYLNSYDFIGRIENIEKDFIIVAEKINIGTNKLSELNSTGGAPTAYRHKYNEKTKLLISQRYQKDIEFFNYEY